MPAQSAIAIRNPDWWRSLARRLDPMDFDLLAWAVSLAVCAALVLVCYAAVDRPVARFFEPGGGYNPLIPVLARVPGLLRVAVIGFGLTIPLLAIRRRTRRAAIGMVVAALAYLFADLAKDTLKFVFGRTWPETWMPGQASYVRNGLYGFFPFHAGPDYGSFPSGHMCVTMALVVVGCVLWPRLRLLWGVLAVAMALLLVGLNFHFCGDVIAGAWLGTACSVAVLKAVRRLRPAWLPARPRVLPFGLGTGHIGRRGTAAT